MNRVTRFCYPNFVKGKKRKIIFLPLYFLIALLCILGSPVLATVPNAMYTQILELPHPNPPLVKGREQDFPVSPLGKGGLRGVAQPLEQGKALYDAGRFAEAVQVLQQAVQEYRQSQDSVKLAITLSNLSLAYQQLGAWEQAEQAIAESLNLLKSQNLPIFAQSLDIQGRLQLAMGKPDEALETWKQTAKIYRQIKNQNGEMRSQINQAQAWKIKGFYLRAVKILQQVGDNLKSQPDSREKLVGLRSLGDALMIVEDLAKSSEALEQSLAIAQRLQLPADTGATFLSLGNNARLKQQKLEAIAYYQQALTISTSPLTQIQAQLNQLSLLIEDKQLATAENLIPSIQSQLSQFPLSRAGIYAQINFAQSLMKVVNKDLSVARKNLSTLSAQDIGLLLANTVKQSRSLGDQRAEAYALLSLGSMYEQTQQWQDAQSLTEKGLILAQTTNAPDISYRLEWQLGRLRWVQKDIQGAIAAYDGAVETLKSLRSDLVAVNQEAQFNFRDSVEPIYRQSVELLLQSQNGKVDEKTLDKARQRIEALQLAELDNFFREACLQGQSVQLDKVVDQDNPTAAILYPIILPQQIQVIVKIPNKPLQQYSTNIPQTEVDKVLSELRKTLVNPAAIKAIKTQSQQVYNWLLRPIESELSASKVKTLVFVLDGALRNLPMASLYDGKQYLVEKYAIALSVGLQLLDPKPLVKQQLRALTAGLTEIPADFPNIQEFSKFGPLPAIKSELDAITKAGVSTTSLLNKDFKRKKLEKEVNTASFNVVHLATHGQFSSRAEDTFILAADALINVREFDTLFGSRDINRPGAVELLVLSACQTAAGDNRAALGLAGAAVRAGARSTLASLWQIDDSSTALFIGDFYQELKSGNVTKAEALRHAQLKLLQHPNYQAPSFWGAYVLIGNWL